MNSRTPRSTPRRAPIAPIHRGPQSLPTPGAVAAPFHHAPNAALLIDFDNVTMGIRSDLGKELRNLLSSEIIKGKVAVQRAYADWRRYPQYIVPLSESSIDLIFAPAYGSSKKNATDIRLAIDALELVFTRPEIGTFILLSGDSDFSSLVIKLKEYGKYVIGVGIRESSSDLLVQNCDEYYSYNALAGLVKSSDEEIVKWDPWELVTEAITRMKRNNDVMRSDRLKQVMQEIDPAFDEKNLNISKFSRFALEAAHRGLLKVSRLDNGQLEVDIPDGAARPPAATPAAGVPAVAAEVAEEVPERARRGRRGRGRGRDREERGDDAAPRAAERTPDRGAERVVERPAERAERAERGDRGPRPERGGRAEPRADAVVVARPDGREAPHRDEIGTSGERLTRDEAFDLVRRSVHALTHTDDDTVSAGDVRKRAFTILGRDSESLSDRNFRRILQDAHDADVIDLRRRGEDFEVSRAARAEPVAAQLRAAQEQAAPAVPPARTSAPRGIGVLGRSRPRRGEAPPADLFAVGVVDIPSPAIATATVTAPPAEIEEPDVVVGAPEADERAAPPKAAKKAGGRKRGRAAAKKQGRKAAKSAPAAEAAEPPPADRPRRPRARKAAAKSREG